MIRGLYVSSGAMTPAMRAQEILANNLANVSTGGFRQDRLAFHGLLDARMADAPGAGPEARGTAGAGLPGAVGPGGPGAVISPGLRSGMDLSPGVLETTGDRLHLAVSGAGFFGVQGPEGELYTRDGALRLTEDGTLVHRSGYPVITGGGALTLPPGATFDVASDGTVLINGEPGGKISLFALPDASQIRHAGAGLISYTGDAEEDAASGLVQGALEGSNVDPVSIMVEMMALLRGMEANQKAIVAQDGSLGRLIQWAAG